MEFVLLKTKGKFYRVPRAPCETDEQAMDRVWHIAKQDGPMNIPESLKWSYEKYLKVKY